MDPPRPRPDVLFIVNPAANGGRAASRWQREVEPLIDERLRVIDPTDGSSTVRVLYTRGPGDAETFSRDAVESGSARVVVAAGGDGTISEVFNGFFAGLGRAPAVPDPDGQQPPAALAVLPCGTGSDLIRSFGWDRSPASGIRRIAGGQRAKVDLLRLTWRGGRFHRDVVRHCANVASAGISSAVAGLAPRYKWLGPTLCYALGTVHAFLTRHTDLSLEVCVDGGEWQRLDRATCVVLGNGAYFGGGMKIAPDAKVDSGSVQVCGPRPFAWHHGAGACGALVCGCPAILTTRARPSTSPVAETDAPAAGRTGNGAGRTGKEVGRDRGGCGAN